ncbi:hypothetical protein K474DRAFT_1706400 [Panus rudis PR-1116 ss-1]|nr:hypothetical protein K474DRAFT_1706400 [Panus rudis PR-1116 ss-1]
MRFFLIEHTRFLNHLAVHTKKIGEFVDEIGGSSVAYIQGYLTKEGFRSFDVESGNPGTLGSRPLGGQKRTRAEDSKHVEDISRKKKKEVHVEQRKEKTQDEKEKDGKGESDVRDVGGPKASMEQ